jgi:hypothetical protein
MPRDCDAALARVVNRRGICAACALVVSACGFVPPPPAWPFEGAVRDPVSSTSVAVYGGGFGYPGGNYWGEYGGLRASRQTSEDVSLGFEAAGAGSFLAAGGRVHAIVHPIRGDLAVRFGVGGGATQAGAMLASGTVVHVAPIAFATLDEGVSMRLGRNRYIDSYIGARLSQSVPTVRVGPGALPDAATILYAGADMGIVLRPSPVLQIGVAIWADTGLRFTDPVTAGILIGGLASFRCTLDPHPQRAVASRVR